MSERCCQQAGSVIGREGRSINPIILALAAYAVAHDTLESVKAAFEAAGIVGDVIPAFDPTVLLSVTFPSGTFAAGTLLTPAQMAQRPRFAVKTAHPSRVKGKTFLIAEVDPDAPTPQDPSVSQIRHFVAPDFTVAKTKHGLVLVNGSQALSEYVGPAPPAGSDPHRYTFLLFEQADAGVIPPPDFRATDITGFDIQQFVDEVNAAGNNTLTLVGGTFFLSQAQAV